MRHIGAGARERLMDRTIWISFTVGLLTGSSKPRREREEVLQSGQLPHTPTSLGLLTLHRHSELNLWKVRKAGSKTIGRQFKAFARLPQTEVLRRLGYSSGTLVSCSSFNYLSPSTAYFEIFLKCCRNHSSLRIPV